MLWGLPWDRMNLAESNRLTVISYLIQNAVVRETVIWKHSGSTVIWAQQHFGKRGIYTAGKCVF